MDKSELLDIITDPDLGGCEFSYGRVTETVDAKGRAAHTETIHSAQGNIQPAPGRERELLPDEDSLKSSILIFTPADLTAGVGDIKADRIFYRNGIYRVVLAELWREHAGFTKALAVLDEDTDD
jgi:hypothetical protein